MGALSYLLSLALHAAVILAVLFWPTPKTPLLDLNTVQISLVEGAPGGNKLPSPVLGPQGTPGQEQAIAEPAPQKPDVVRERPDMAQSPVTEPKETPKQAEPKPKPKEEKPRPTPEKPDATPISEKKKETKKPEPKEPPKPQPQKDAKEQPASQQAQKKAGKEEKKGDPIQDALKKARSASSRDAQGKGSAVERALAEAKRNAGGNRGGGGGEGSGPGGGGLLDVFIGQIMMAVRANWTYPSASRANLVCIVHIKLDASGKLLEHKLTRSSGNAQFDASAITAVLRTGKAEEFPAPPNAACREVDLSFNLSEMRGR